METTVKTSFDWRKPLNICRCCLTDGCYKDISSEYYFSGQKEVYEDMLRETYDVQISYQKAGGPSLGSRLICDSCILKLRDAFTFKQTVLRSEMSFAEYLDELRSHQTEENKLLDCDLKLEPVKVEDLPIVDVDFDIKCDAQNGDDFHDDGSFDDDDDEILANIAPVKRRKHALERKSKKRAKINNTHGDIVVDFGQVESNSSSCKKKGKWIYDAHDILKTQSKAEKNWLKISERRGNGPILRENSLKLLANSTMCVFQWNKSRYRCFCCKEPFSDMSLLRDHTNNKHTLENIEKKIILQQNRLVKVEVTTLFCKICNCEVENLTTLRYHLCKIHEILFESEEDLLVPFKIDSSNLQCQICSETFTMFRLLNIHMNKHYQKQVCHICGAGFSNLVFLNLHKTRSHRPFNCKPCDIVFSNKLDKKDHDISVHNVKFERKLRFPCPYCSERFFQENFRVQHLVEKHGMKKPEHKCLMCSKVFITRSLCNNHMKNVHMKEKNQECEICHHLFYTKSDVARHKVTHTGEKKFSCSLCSNLFATKDSLRRHMKRTHASVN